MDKDKFNETIVFCLTQGYLKDAEGGVTLTKTGVDLLEEKIEKLYTTMQKLGTISKTASKKKVADIFLSSMNDSVCSALVFLISEVEPIGYENWVKFENLDLKNTLPN